MKLVWFYSLARSCSREENQTIQLCDIITRAKSSNDSLMLQICIHFLELPYQSITNWVA